jgi:hypothetical protein
MTLGRSSPALVKPPRQLQDERDLSAHGPPASSIPDSSNVRRSKKGLFADGVDPWNTRIDPSAIAPRLYDLHWRQRGGFPAHCDPDLPSQSNRREDDIHSKRT